MSEIFDIFKGQAGSGSVLGVPATAKGETFQGVRGWLDLPPYKQHCIAEVNQHQKLNITGHIYTLVHNLDQTRCPMSIPDHELDININKTHHK